ncbi:MULTISPECIES: hypothetical protein [unclassified Microbacterium]|uniref:hypothetical protein n=1 Tax=unclassified Microbacterium TaxID=2609290 RepID=UPI0030163EE1
MNSDRDSAFTTEERQRIEDEWIELAPGTSTAPALAAMERLAAETDPFNLAQLRRWRAKDQQIIGVTKRGPVFGKLS